MSHFFTLQYILVNRCTLFNQYINAFNFFFPSMALSVEFAKNS